MGWGEGRGRAELLGSVVVMVLGESGWTMKCLHAYEMF